MAAFTAFAVPAIPAHGLPWWLWLAASIIPDVVLVTIVVRLGRRLVSSRRQSHNELIAARAELTRCAESLWLATELADVGVWCWDLPTGTLSWSERCKRHFGLRVNEAVTIDRFYAALHPDDRERVRAAIERSRADRTEFHSTYRAVLPNGSHRELTSLGRFTYDARGVPLSMGGVTLDVSRTMRLESDLRLAETLSDRRAAELERLRRFQIVAENASDVVMETDDVGVIRWVTPSVTLQLGRRPEDVTGTLFTQLVHPDDWDKMRSMDRQVRLGMPVNEELRLRMAAGGCRWFSVSLRPVFDDRQAVIGRVGGWRDIHAEVRAREAVTVERRRLRAQMMSTLNPVVIGQPVRDASGRTFDFIYADVNQAACDFIGIDREHLLGRRLVDLFPQLKTTGLLARFVDTADTGRPTTVDDFPFPMHGDTVHRMDVRAVRADEWVHFAWRDNSERYAAMERLAASEEQFRLLAENSLDVVVRIDAQDQVVWVSPSVTSVLGWNVADWVGHAATDFLATEETRRQYRDDKARVFAGAGAVSRSEVRSKTGAVHWMEAHSSPFRQPDGRIDGLIAAMRVIDAEVAAERALQHRARIDDLTGLLNRKELLDRLDDLLDSGACGFAVLWCDIDRFKETNDIHGHAAGDAVLAALGERIRSCLPQPDDLSARIGGDELMLVLRGVHDLDEAVRVAEQLRRAAAGPIPFEGRSIMATLSIGVTLAGPGEGSDAVLARADDAMYQAKHRGRDQVAVNDAPTAPAGHGRRN